jgi:hypothetical protein
VLNDLVGGRLSTTTLDQSVTVTLQRESILANVDPPDVLNGARTLAVNTLDLVYEVLVCDSIHRVVLHTLSDDGVLEGTAVLDEEDSVSVATLGLTSAGNTTAVGLQATVESTLDNHRGLVGDRALGGRDWDRGALAKASEASGSRGSRASNDGSGEGSDSGDDSELHFGGCWWIGTLKVESDRVVKCVVRIGVV